MSGWQDSHKNPIVDFRKFLQERIDKTNPRRQLEKKETTKQLSNVAAFRGVLYKI